MGGCSNTIHTTVQGVNLMNEYVECASRQDVGGVRIHVCDCVSMRLQKYTLTLFFSHTLTHTHAVNFHNGSSQQDLQCERWIVKSRAGSV